MVCGTMTHTMISLAQSDLWLRLNVSDSLIPRHGNVLGNCYYWPSKRHERVVDELTSTINWEIIISSLTQAFTQTSHMAKACLHP